MDSRFCRWHSHNGNMKTLLLLLLLFPVYALSGPAECPSYEPPLTTSDLTTKWRVSAINQDFDDLNSACQAFVSWYSAFGSRRPYTKTGITPPTTCLFRDSWGYDQQETIPKVQVCPDGYTGYSGVCTLTDINSVQCPKCISGESVGQGGAETDLVCLDGCVIKPRGMTAAEIDASGNSIGIKLSEWVKTGSECVTGGSLPVANNIDKSKPNCISNGARQLCIDLSKPGCGLVNGKEWCPDKVGCGSVNGQRVCVPDDGGCTPSGGLDFACTKGATPPPAPAGEPPPVVDFKGTVPVQDTPAPTGGTPSTGALPNSSGSDTGGSAPVIIGHYPGNSGNGTIDNPTQNNPGSNGSEGRNGSGNGSGNIDTSGLAQESSLQSLGGLVTQIRDSLGGTVSGSAFTATTPGTHANVNLSPEVTAKQTELSTKLAQVKAEFGQLLSFGSSSNAQALQCPANSGFTFYGSTISLCTQSVLSATATIGNVLIFLAFVVSLFILLS